MKPQQDLLEVISEDLMPVTEIDIKALAEIYDEKDIYLSVYLPVSGRENEHLNRIFVDSRVKSIKKALSSKLRSEFEKTFEMAEPSIIEAAFSGERGRIIFACSSESFLHVYRLAVEPEQSLVLDTSPFLLPLARLRADYDDYGILLVDSQEARFVCIRSDLAEEKKHLSTDLMNKHKKGGWSQMRFNHLRKGAIKSFLSEVADNVRGTCDQLQTRGLIIAGPGDAKQQLMDLLPQDIRQSVIGVIDVSMTISRDELVEEGDSVLHENELSRSGKRAAEFKNSLLRGGLVAHGVEDVRAALEQARVNTLLILKGSSVPGWICEKCQNLQANTQAPKECDRCGGMTSVVDVVEELYELAQRTGAEVEFVEKEDFLDSDDVAGALLRY
ncbi:Vms1/Ankzf1 family peptidyl-tRNA hydrolase [Methanolobus sp.]|jgi:peptide chain release factor subunit 1|uniref:baeRF10 domain-containing protein n=1 Tax=Methanolobus sp. TaxID=1874737 RepID=UPI0025EFBD9D|nr:Vms1/Ankzf1 family peptidyl-tRNA hydrolase [Methanolobus sp.]